MNTYQASIVGTKRSNSSYFLTEPVQCLNLRALDEPEDPDGVLMPMLGKQTGQTEAYQLVWSEGKNLLYAKEELPQLEGVSYCPEAPTEVEKKRYLDDIATAFPRAIKERLPELPAPWRWSYKQVIATPTPDGLRIVHLAYPKTYGK